jgi:hypothetical protein
MQPAFFVFVFSSLIVASPPQFDNIPFNNHSTGVANRLGKHPQLDDLVQSVSSA